MNTNKLKRFAQDARKKLIEQVGTKLEQVFNTDSAELREKAEQVKKLQEAINSTSKAQVIDKVAYTWFNRLMALRFMDANDYQPIGVRVITPKDGYILPELLNEAQQGHIPDDLPVKKQHIYDLLDGKIPSTNPQNEAYKELLIGACNHLNKVFPFLFERIEDYTELLLPDDLISEFSIVQDMRDGMTTEDCQEVEIIGWLYQFYISEKKDEVFASKSKVKKEDIPAATQLFTPRWIVEYMVQNTVGKLWLQNRPNSKLRDQMPYFIESPSLKSEEYLKVSSVEEITLLDQASGSGHILVYGFELFTKIYEEEGYNPSDIPQLIIEKNLFGFEIDERAAQLSGMALMMKARSYQRRVFRKELKPNILCYSDLKITSQEIKDLFRQLSLDLSDKLLHDLKNMQQATNLGSLIIPHTSEGVLSTTLEKVKVSPKNTDVFLAPQLNNLVDSLTQLILLSKKHHCVVDNPPYMGGGNMNKELADFVKNNYPDSKSDLMACFMEAGFKMLLPKAYISMVNMHSWMFLSSYEALRKYILQNLEFDTILHLGMEAFDGIIGKVVQTAAWVLKNSEHSGGDFTSVRLVDYYDKRRWEKKDHFYDSNHRYNANQKDFEKIPSYPIAYWLSKNARNLFGGMTIKDRFELKQGLATGDNNRFLRYWSEIGKGSFISCSRKYSTDFKWYPYNKGGVTRRWFGNQEFVVNWKNDGEEIKNNFDSNGKQRSRPQNLSYFFRESLTWSLLANTSFAVRRQPPGAIFDINGMSIFFKETDKIELLQGQLASKVGYYLLQAINPTLAFQLGNVASLPTIDVNSKFESNILLLVSELIEISKIEWNSKETSWDFNKNELTQTNGHDLEETYDLYQQYWKNKFFQLHKNEEELNRQFIEIYGLQDELTPDVPLEDITILKEETSIENGQLVFHADEVIVQFVSYAVGCMFGRYSLDKEGLILANQGETLEDYLHKIAKSKQDASFLPDDDNIIPILDDEWFEDDIVGRFYEFLKVSFGKENFDKNLAFVEESLGKDIRKYFMRDFYNDHIKRYKKRPIYWMFSSPKGSFNVLIYMHRYTPDTLNQILNGYLKEYREKLNNHIEQLDHIIVIGSSTEQTKASKEKDKLKLVLLELQEYERDILYPLATERIPIDLDDGVLVNYNKFGKAIKEVAGLNDKATKKNVREFDWINTDLIR